MIAVALHPTDVRILDAYEALRAGSPGQITDFMLSESIGLAEKTCKNRRLSLAKRGLWPGPVREGKLPIEVRDRIVALHDADPPPRYRAIAEVIRAEFGRSVHEKTVERTLHRPEMERTRAIRKAIRREALAEFRRRHEPGWPRGEPVAAILERFGYARGGRT